MKDEENGNGFGDEKMMVLMMKQYVVVGKNASEEDYTTSIFM